MFGPDYFKSIAVAGVGLGVNLDDLNDTLLAPATKGVIDYFEVSAADVRRPRTLSYRDVNKMSAPHAAAGPATIEELSRSRRVIIHSTNVNPVYPDLPDRDALETLGKLLETTGSPWFTEDLGIWLMHQRHVYPYFMQFPMTTDTLTVTVENVRQIQKIIGRPFNAEFPPMAYVLGDLHAFDFFRILTEETGCGMAIDVGHVLSYQLARGESATADFHRLPWESVTEVHVAGGNIDLTPAGFLYQDDHGDEDIVSICLDLVDAAIAYAPNLKAITFEIFGAVQPRRTLNQLSSIRSRMAVARWLANEPAPRWEPAPGSYRDRARASMLGLDSVLHSSNAVDGTRLAQAGAEFLDAFAVQDKQRLEYDRSARTLLMGQSTSKYFPLAARWICRHTEIDLQELFEKVAPKIDRSEHLGYASVAAALREVAQEFGDDPALYEIIRCEAWFNECAVSTETGQVLSLSIDIERVRDYLKSSDGVKSAVLAPTMVEHVGGANFRRLHAADLTICEHDPEMGRGTGPCCTGGAL